MFKPFLVLLLALAAIHPAHAQEYPRESPAPSTTDSGLADSAGLRLVFDPRLVPPARVDSPLASNRAVDAPSTRLSATDSYWKRGAAIGAVVGALAGFGFGYTMDNIINEGEWSVGEATIGGTLFGAVGGGLVGAGIGSLIRR